MRSAFKSSIDLFIYFFVLPNKGKLEAKAIEITT